MKRSVAAVVLFVSLAACGSGTSGTGHSPGDSVVTPALVTVALHSDGGGFHSVPPGGAACDPGKWTYVITMATHDVAWTGCLVTGTGAAASDYVPGSADHAVDATHWPAVQTDLVNVRISDRTSCGADKDSWTLILQTASGEVTYGDDFYACEQQYATYVTTDSLSALYATLSQLP